MFLSSSEIIELSFAASAIFFVFCPAFEIFLPSSSKNAILLPPTIQKYSRSIQQRTPKIPKPNRAICRTAHIGTGVIRVYIRLNILFNYTLYCQYCQQISALQITRSCENVLTILWQNKYSEARNQRSLHPLRAFFISKSRKATTIKNRR